MDILIRWVLPIAMLAVGIAILTGSIFKQIPRGTGLRILLGLVVVLFAVYRFVAARIPRTSDRRRFGGEGPRPWER